MKIVIVGGHLSPALAVIEKLPKDIEILYIGRKHALEGDKADSLEFQKITEMKIPFVNLETARLQRKFTKHTIPSFLKLPKGFFQAFKVIKKFKPDAVICFGGYLQIPVVFAAYFQRIPVIIHEQTLRAGLANKIAAPFVNVICISWPESAKFFPPKKTILTGLPLRKEFLKINPSHTLSPKPYPLNPKILITGGSLGAHAINALIEDILEKLLQKYYIIHQAGDAKEFGDYERLINIKEKLPRELVSKYELVKFIDPDKIAQTMAGSDLVISRAGINTAAELIYLKKACILIPLPHGQTNEQLENALFVQKTGLGKVLNQDDLTPELLYSQIVELTATLNKGPNSVHYEKEITKYDPAEKIVKIITDTQKQQKQ